jgi:hypothetical protein
MSRLRLFATAVDREKLFQDSKDGYAARFAKQDAAARAVPSGGRGSPTQKPTAHFC